jgi:hypothetical protein
MRSNQEIPGTPKERTSGAKRFGSCNQESVICRSVRRLLFAGLFFVFLNFSTLQSTAVLPGSLTLAWDPSDDPGVVGYRIYEGMATQTYTIVIDVGNNLNATIFGLAAGETYYFAVTAYDSSGLESSFSGELSYFVPSAQPQLFVSPPGPSAAVLSGTGPAGSLYDVHASMDLSSWITIGQVTIDGSGAFQFTDSDSNSLPWRFYRLKQISP